jgi:hypothetical protein
MLANDPPSHKIPVVSDCSRLVNNKGTVTEALPGL